MKAALSIVLRKDMSLNRRLYAWFLGDDGSSQIQMKYFRSYGERAAIQAVRGLFFTTTNSNHQHHQEHHHSSQQHQNEIQETYIIEAQRPYKILISLLDKWEIGQPIVQGIFTNSLVSLQTQVHKVEASAEVSKI